MWKAFKLKFSLDVVVTIVFWANFMNEKLKTEDRSAASWKFLFTVQKVNPLKQFGNTIWIVDPFTQVKSAEHKIQHKIHLKSGDIL